MPICYAGHGVSAWTEGYKGLYLIHKADINLLITTPLRSSILTYCSALSGRVKLAASPTSTHAQNVVIFKVGPILVMSVWRGCKQLPLYNSIHTDSHSVTYLHTTWIHVILSLLIDVYSLVQTWMQGVNN